MDQQNGSFQQGSTPYNGAQQQNPIDQPNYSYSQQTATQNASQPPQNAGYQQVPPQQQYQQTCVPQQQYVQTQSPQVITTGCKIMYLLLGLFVPFIGLICLVCSDKNVISGALREKAKWLAIGSAVLVLLSLLYYFTTGITALSGFDAGSSIARSCYSL